MLTDLLKSFVTDMTHALTGNDYGMPEPERMLIAVGASRKLEAEVQRLQDKFTATEAAQKQLECYMQNHRRYLQLRNLAKDDLSLVVVGGGNFLRGTELDTKVDALIGKKPLDFSKFTLTTGKPVLHSLNGLNSLNKGELHEKD